MFNEFPLNGGERMSGAILGIYPVLPAHIKPEVKAHGRIKISLQGVEPLPTNVSFELPGTIPAIVSHIRNAIIAPLDDMVL